MRSGIHLLQLSILCYSIVNTANGHRHNTPTTSKTKKQVYRRNEATNRNGQLHHKSPLVRRRPYSGNNLKKEEQGARRRGLGKDYYYIEYYYDYDYDYEYYTKDDQPSESDEAVTQPQTSVEVIDTSLDEIPRPLVEETADESQPEIEERTSIEGGEESDFYYVQTNTYYYEGENGEEMANEITTRHYPGDKDWHPLPPAPAPRPSSKMSKKCKYGYSRKKSKDGYSKTSKSDKYNEYDESCAPSISPSPTMSNKPSRSPSYTNSKKTPTPHFNPSNPTRSPTRRPSSKPTEVCFFLDCPRPRDSIPVVNGTRQKPKAPVPAPAVVVPAASPTAPPVTCIEGLDCDRDT